MSARGKGLPFLMGDLVITGMAALAMTYLLVAGRWAPGAWHAIGSFALVGLGLPALRGLAWRCPRWRIFDFAASTWILPTVILVHYAMNPVVDAVNPRLFDGWLAWADLRLFGVHPSVWLGQYTVPALTDLLMACYYSYFWIPIAVGVALYLRDRRAFDEFHLLLALLFAANFALYVAVPAVGPRFFLAHEFPGPLQGGWITSLCDSLMRGPEFNRDCFPSGHTAVTLGSLAFAFRYQRTVFWILLPIGVGLIWATLLGRFHYGIDLLAALPLLAAGMTAAGWFARGRQRLIVRLPATHVRQPAQI